METVSRGRRWGSGLIAAALLSSAVLVGAANPAAADPATGSGSVAADAGAVTMVNGEGRRVTIPSSLAASLASRSAAGAAGSRAAAGVAATTKSRGAGTNAVIGTDDRTPEYDPLGYPWGAIVYLSTNQGQCTGFMLSRDVVVTAGHCVYSGGWVTSYRAVPGKNGTSEPFGSCSGGIADVWTNSTWISNGSADADYGLVKLTCDIGYTVGWFGWWYSTGENLVGTSMYIEGYPGDKPFATMWWDSDPIASQSATRLFHSIDTAGGQSGAPIYHYNSTVAGLCSGWCVTGIHKGAVGSQNHGTRFNPTVMSFINYWIGQP
ncbi:trypsin-like serine protease [Micromonospora sp. NPDC049523]|uniref:trypsin-like serine peptidase n=1 Tax=Micromonospora sp. NPDC049523 TaxID=3155921 RepID=UPI0034221578